MRATGILDTNTVILLPEIQDPGAPPQYPTITAITLAELSVGPLVARTELERAARQAHLQQAEADFQPLPMDAAATRAFGMVASDIRKIGRKTTAQSYDALIAAVAIANDLPLYTVNPHDFRGITRLQVVAVPHPTSG